jgi:hypothetical protein
LGTFWLKIEQFYLNQGSFQQSLVEIGSVVSEEKIFLISSPLFSNLQWPRLLYFKPESAQI